MSLEWFTYRVLNKLHGVVASGKTSYSQCGEDLIIRYVFDVLKIPCPVYLDIGAHHPRFLSNTFLFYQQGAHGINIEPDPTLFAAFPKQRNRDTNLNIDR